MKINKKVLFPIICIALVLYVVWIGIQNSDSILLNKGDQDKVNIFVIEPKIYTNDAYGFSFTYPDNWHIGNNNLGQGALQLFNYDESKLSGESFSSGMNKIEAVIVAENIYDQEDYSEETHTTENVVVGGQEASRIDIEFMGGEKIRGYLVSLPNDDEKFLAITMYGDPANFSILNDLAESLEWVR